MQFSIGLPTMQVDLVDEFLTASAIAEMARCAEANGFAACFVTDHPAPDQRWLETGGHHALDPLVALSFAAAATTTLRVQTHIFVLAYRNPLLAAKGVLTLDVLSGGRLTLGVAAGYLRSEFNALGVDYDERNDLVDEAIDVLKRVLADDAVAFEGRHFRSRGTTMRPRPVQRPHPPIWVGGNSKRAIRRAVETAQGWCPFPNPAAASPAVKTPKLETIGELTERITYAREYAAEIGRTEPFDICVSPMARTLSSDNGSYPDYSEGIAALEALGVTWVPVDIAAATRAEWISGVERFAAAVM